MKIINPGFYCPCDTKYFNDFGKIFALSATEFAPWAHIHFHIFDGTDADIEYCKSKGFTYTIESTPERFSLNLETKKDYWVNIRFVRIPEIYDDSTLVMSIDADSVFVKPLSFEKFKLDLSKSWTTIAAKREQLSLGSAVGFSNDNARFILAKKLLDYLPTDEFKWCLDQKLLDELIASNDLDTMDLRYSDFKMNDESFVWTGKGNRKFKQTFSTLINDYRKKL